MAHNSKVRALGDDRPGARRFGPTTFEYALLPGLLARFVAGLWLCLAAGVARLHAQFPPVDTPKIRQSPPGQTGSIAPQDRQSNGHPASVPTSRPGEFQPGVTIDWNTKTVIVRAELVLRGGPIEFLACRPGKEHESLLLLNANATHVFMALGLVGLEPGMPPKWDEKNQRMSDPSGELVDVSFSWIEGGNAKSVNWNEWVLDAEFLRTPVGRSFVFSGSILRPDGSVACERSGAVLALVDMPDSLISAARSHSERELDLWALANSPALPVTGTEVSVSIRAAEKRHWDFSIGPRGDLLINGRVERIDDAIELMRQQRRFFPSEQIVIQNHAPLFTDEWRLRDRLSEAGIEESVVRFARPSRASPSK